MELIPAIDLLNGHVVRLHKGDYDAVTVYSDDPVGQARAFYAAGARRLHVVDLEGARSGKAVHVGVIRAILAAVPLAVQVGGGIRDAATAEEWLAAGVKRVVVATVDPNPAVSRRGLAQLRPAGIEVATGVEAEAARQLIAGFTRHVTSGRPLVRVKIAASADGRVATRTGASRWITGVEARRLVHRWRNEMDAVLVGVDTVLADDPELTCRRAGGRDPVRVVVDGRLRMPPRSRMLHDGRAPVWIATRTRHDAARARRLARTGATVLPVASRGRHLDLGALLLDLGRRDVTSVLVEAGSRLAAALIAGGHVDELCWFTAPLLIGGDGLPMIGPLGVRSLQGAFPLADLRVERVGADLLHTARVEAR